MLPLPLFNSILTGTGLRVKEPRKNSSCVGARRNTILVTTGLTGGLTTMLIDPISSFSDVMDKYFLVTDKVGALSTVGVVAIVFDGTFGSGCCNVINTCIEASIYNLRFSIRHEESSDSNDRAFLEPVEVESFGFNVRPLVSTRLVNVAVLLFTTSSVSPSPSSSCFSFCRSVIVVRYRCNESSLMNGSNST